MASVAYQSSQAVDAAVSASVVITKPVSLAVDDLMIAQIAIPNGSGGTTITPPAGWATIIAYSTALGMALFSKVATSADVAATNFTFTTDSSASAGIISRFTNAYTVTPIDQSNSAGNQSTSPTTSGITPTVADSMFCIFIVNSSDSGTIRTHSAYAIGTNNPTWTERYDRGSNVVSSLGHSMALATSDRPELSASGNASGSISGAVNNAGIVVLNIAPVPIAVVDAPFSVLAPTVRTIIAVIASAASAALEATPSAIASAWANTSKSVASWLTTDKT